MDQLEKFFEDLFLKKVSYRIPDNAKDVIVKVAPWITLIVLVMMLPAIFAIFGMQSYVAGWGAYLGVHLGMRYYLGLIILAGQAVLMGISVPGLMRREKKGWQYAYYASLVSGVHAVLFSYGPGDIIWSLLGTAIGLYIIFQIKSYYKV